MLNDKKHTQDRQTRNKQLFSRLHYEVSAGGGGVIMRLQAFCYTPSWTSVGLLVVIGCGGPPPPLRCVVPSLLAWHSVMETTSNCAAGSVHPLAPDVAPSSPRLFSCPSSAFPITPPPAPLLLIRSLIFTASPASTPPSLPPLLSVSAFLLRHNAGHSAQKCHGSLDFSP